jgi:predicted amidohydrolase
MRTLRLATAQFEHHDSDKAHNLARIAALSERAADLGAEVVCFHECSITGYTHLQTLSLEAILSLAEPLNDSPSINELNEIARRCGLVVMAGFVERDHERCFNTYVAVDGTGTVLLRHRKLNDFISPHITNGDSYNVAEIRGARFGCLTCYDNNLPENVRITTLLGAEVIVMPHVTGCTPSNMPGRGAVDPALWHRRATDPEPIRREFLGPKGRGWLMKWLPARAWENGVFAVFSNPIGLDGKTIKPGLAMIVDPNGDVLAESNALDDDVVVADLETATFEAASGRRYLRARRPELYGKLTEPHPAGTQSITKPGWALAFETSGREFPGS